MRTVIELSEEEGERLRQLAVRRGETGFAPLVHEAIDRYLREQAAPPDDPPIDAAAAGLGSLTDEEADALEERVRELRGQWR